MIAFKTATEADVPEPFLDFTENTKLRRMEVAAPKMLAALKLVRDDAHRFELILGSTFDAVINAIAEAEGRTA
jgi:hypothetical protein